MDISHYISRLLFRYDCVIVPDFGGFISNYHSAIYKPELHVFSPPTKVLAFNCKLTVNDGLLANYIAQCNQCTFTEASIEIATFVRLINSDLDSGKKVLFDGIGTFTKNTGIVVFQPDNSINRLIDAFGLPVLQLPLSAQETLIPVFENTSEKRNVVRKVLVAIPLVLALALLPLKMSKLPLQGINSSAALSNLQIQYEKKKHILENPSSISDVIDKLTDAEYALYYPQKQKSSVSLPVDSLKNTISVKSTKIPKEKILPKTVNSEITPKIISENHPDKKYFIIAGSFVEMSRVNVFCKELISKNFTPEIIKRDGKLRISVASFSNSEEANHALSLFRQEHPEYPVWLLGS